VSWHSNEKVVQECEKNNIELFSTCCTSNMKWHGVMGGGQWHVVLWEKTKKHQHFK